MIAELLRKGKENAVTTKHLMAVCHFSSKSELQRQIAKERADGALICSTTVGSGGYYLPKDRDEIQKFINSMNSRAKNILKSVTAAREYLNQIEGQQCLDVDRKKE